MTTRIRLIYTTLVVLLVAASAQFVLLDGATAQNADSAQTFADATATATASTPLAGPLSGGIQLDDSLETVISAGVSVDDPIVHAEFIVPDVQSGDVWNVSIGIRTGTDADHLLVVSSTGQWIYIGQGVGNGQGLSIPSAGQPLTIDIVTNGESMLFGVGGIYTDTIDIGPDAGPGDVALDASLVSGAGPATGAIEYQNFQVWDGNNVGSADSSTSNSDTATDSSTTVQNGADDAQIFDNLRSSASEHPIVFGPESNSMPHEEGNIANFGTDVTVTDFVTRVECVAPRSSVEGFWDCGLYFRGADPGDSYLLVYVSDGTWLFSTIDSDDFLAEGDDLPTNLNAGDKVTLNLAVQGNDAYFGVNGDFVSALDVSGKPGPGTVGLASAFFEDTTIVPNGISFEDFIVWSLDDQSQTGATTQPTQETTQEATQTTSSGSSANSYVSPTFGYSLAWDNSWTVDSESSEGGRDALGLSNGTISADLIGESWDSTSGSCFDWLVDYYQNNDAYSNVIASSDETLANGETMGVISMTFTDSQDGSSAAYVNVVLCAPIPGNEQSLVSLEQFVLVDDYPSQADAITDLQQGFELGEGSAQAAQTPTTGDRPTVAATQTPVGQAGVQGNSYTSPTYGYSLTWDDTWSVSREESDDRGDTLVLDGEAGFASLISESWNNLDFDTCYDWLVDYYSNNSKYSDVRSVPTNTMPAPFTTGIIYSTFTSETTGNSTPFVNTVACAPVPGEDDVAVELEIVISESDYTSQIQAVATLQSALALGSNNTGSVASAETPTVAAEPSIEATGETTGQSGVQGNSYVSPTYGYSLTWDDTWSVSREESDDRGDTLVLDGEAGFASLLSESWNDTGFATCYDWLVDYYSNNSKYSDVRSVPTSTMPAPFTTGIIYSTFTSDTTGNSTPFVNTVACAPVPGEDGVAVELEIVIPESDYTSQIQAVTTLQSALTLGPESTGGNSVPTVEPPATIAPAATATEGTTSGRGGGASTATSAVFALQEMNNSGVKGVGAMEVGAGAVTVTAIVVGASQGDQVTAVAVSCADFTASAQPDFIIGELNATGLFSQDLQTSLSTFLNSPYSIVVYPAGNNFTTPLACGEIQAGSA